MRFTIDDKVKTQDKLLIYNEYEYAFEVEPYTHLVEFYVVINYLDLLVNDGGYVVQITGICPYKEWKPMDNVVPNYISGGLKVLTDLEYGFSYRLNEDKEWQVFVNEKTGWVCIGNPTFYGDAVEFCKNCVAVLDNDNLVAIWLKPKGLPRIFTK